MAEEETAAGRQRGALLAVRRRIQWLLEFTKPLCPIRVSKLCGLWQVETGQAQKTTRQYLHSLADKGELEMYFNGQEEWVRLPGVIDKKAEFERSHGLKPNTDLLGSPPEEGFVAYAREQKADRLKKAINEVLRRQM